MADWEYEVIHLNLTDKWRAKKAAEELRAFVARFNEMGAEGWELVAYESVPLTGAINVGTVNGYAKLAFFKRPVTV